MISVIIATLNDERRLAGTMAPLVQAALDGLVRQVIITDGGSTDATLEVADDAGATLVSGGLAAGCAKAREPWLLIMDVGARLPPGWERVAYNHMQATPARAGRIEAARSRLGGWLAKVAGRTVVGLLLPKMMVQGEASSPATLAQALGRARTASLSIHATMEP